MAYSKLTRHQRGYGWAWIKLRRIVFKRDKYLCQPCLREGMTTAATQVDHIRPKAKGGGDELTNLQSICNACADIKNAIDRGAPLVERLPVDASGWQVWKPNAR